MLNMIKGLVGSKKFVVTVSALIATLLAKYKLNVDPTMIQYFVGLVIAYVIGQGIADNGKAAAQVAAIAEVATGTSTQKVDAIKSV